MRFILLALALMVAGCTTTHTLTTCRGSFASANPGKWQPTSAELAP
jgi:hypothetical protein